jgi:hypothetical protein
VKLEKKKLQYFTATIKIRNKKYPRNPEKNSTKSIGNVP